MGSRDLSCTGPHTRAAGNTCDIQTMLSERLFSVKFLGEVKS